MIVTGIFFVIIVVFILRFRKLDELARKQTAKWFKTKITAGYNGTWSVKDEKIPGLRKFFIESIQLVWIMTFFALLFAIVIGAFYFVEN